MTPDKYTIKETFLPVGDDHELYVHEWGTATSATTFLFLHGGPGSGCSDSHKEFFAPTRDRVIFFDQRGSGKSLPYGLLKSNTTQHLVDDITKILDSSDTEKVVIVGGSWGSTLALAYVLAQPERVEGLVVRGIFTGSKAEIDFMEKGGFRHFYPDVWGDFVASVPKKYQDDPAAYHQKRLLGSDKEAMQASSLAYSLLEGSIMKLDDRVHPPSVDDFDPFPMRIEVHYTNELCFMPDRYLLDNASKITVPVWIIQGRYDNVCPPITAYELHQKLPNSQLIWTTAGHSGSDRANYDATSLAITSIALK